MRKIFSTRKKVIIAGVAAVAVIGTGSAAYAYFGASGNGTGNATVGTATGWTVSGGTGDNALVPGGTDNVPFTVTNTNSQPLVLNTTDVTWTIDNDGTNVLKADDSAAAGCLASWFTQGSPTVSTSAVGPSSSVTVPANGTATLTLPVIMTNTTSNQDACEGITGPHLTVTIK